MNAIDTRQELEPEEDLDDDLENEDDTNSGSDNVGETSVEINVDELIAELEAEGLCTKHLRGNHARRRLEEIMEQKRISRELGDFDDFDIDDD